MSDFNDDGRCFVCGPENPLGLKLEFASVPGDGVEAAVRFPAHLQGWAGVVHGGLLATVLDETLIKTAAAKGLKCVTAEITVRFRQPARTDHSYRARGRLVEVFTRLVRAESELVDEQGRPVASASGKLFVT